MTSKVKNPGTVYAYIVSMTIAFTTRYADFSFQNNHLQMFIGLFWIIFALMQLCLNGFRFKGAVSREVPFFLKLYFVPGVLIHLYTIVLIVLGIVPNTVFTTNISTYIPTLVAVFSIYMFGINALRYTTIALIASWVLSVFVSLMAKGPLIFPHAIVQAYIDPFDTMGGLFMYNYLELHDVVLAMGYILTFYIFSKEKLTRKNFGIIVSVLFIMALGMKRVSVLGVVLACLFHWLIKRLSEKKQYRICAISGWAGFALCYLFVFILTYGSVFFDFLVSNGINAMGRNYYYSAIVSKITFGPSFLGLGRNAVSQLLGGEFSYMRVMGVHSDILKMYAECGFVMFGLWLWYYLVFVFKKYKDHFSIKDAVIYFGMMIYAFVLFTTDNTEIYFICQIFLILIPACNALRNKYT